MKRGAVFAYRCSFPVNIIIYTCTRLRNTEVQPRIYVRHPLQSLSQILQWTIPRIFLTHSTNVLRDVISHRPHFSSSLHSLLLIPRLKKYRSVGGDWTVLCQEVGTFFFTQSFPQVADVVAFQAKAITSNERFACTFMSAILYLLWCPLNYYTGRRSILCVRGLLKSGEWNLARDTGALTTSHVEMLFRTSAKRPLSQHCKVRGRHQLAFQARDHNQSSESVSDGRGSWCIFTSMVILY